MGLPKPHLEKLKAVLNNDKLPPSDRPRLEKAINKYKEWISNIRSVDGDPMACMQALSRLLSDYKMFMDVDVVFDCDNDFLYRQKGQLKLDNSIIEEFLPWLLLKTVPDAVGEYTIGPTNCYAAIVFESGLRDTRPGAGIQLRTKDQDFALSRKLYIKASHVPDYQNAAQVITYIAYVATEIKTNLDKTMFQEACATARDLRMAVPASRYFLMCEWLDMTPVSTAPTDVREVLILRGRRLGSDVRKNFSDATRRRGMRDAYVSHLAANPFREDVLRRWVEHIKSLFTDHDPLEDDVLRKGYF